MIKRIGISISGLLLPLFLLIVISFVATAFVLFSGWLLSLVTPLTLWQATIIASVGLILSAYTLNEKLPKKDNLSAITVFAPLSALVMLVIILPLIWVIPLISSLDAWQSALVGAATTFLIGYHLLSWLGDGVTEDLYLEGAVGLEKYVIEQDWDEYIGELEEGDYVLIRNIHTDEPMILAVDEIDPDAPCPCKSRRKYRNCHGQGRVPSQTQKRRRR